MDSCFCGLYLVGDGSKLPLAMSSSIWRALISAALRLAIVSGKPMYSQKRLPCHYQANRSRSWKTPIFTEPFGISQIYRIEDLGLFGFVTPK